MFIEAKYEITSERLADLMVSAVEGNSMVASWCSGIYLAGKMEDKESEWATPLTKGSPYRQPWYSNPKLYDCPDLQICIHEIVDETSDGDVEKHLVSTEDFKRAFEMMAKDQPRHLNDFLIGNEDAITADVFLQLLALKELRYG